MDKYNYTSVGVHRDEMPTARQEEPWTWAAAYATDERVQVALRRWVQGMEEALGRAALKPIK